MANRYSVPLVLSLHDGIKLLQRRSDIQSALEQTRREFSETTLRGARPVCAIPATGAPERKS